MTKCIRQGCGKTVTGHGNQKYCSKTCSTASRLQRQKKYYSWIKGISKKLLHNVKLFEQWLNGRKTLKIEYLDALQQGFDCKAFYGKTVDADNKPTYYLNDYKFYFSKDERTTFLHLTSTP
jgi:hypothetical protein